MEKAIIDTHCHLYVEDFQTDIQFVIEDAQTEGVNKFILPAIDSSTHDAMISLESRFPNVCYAMIGVHPCSIKENFEMELQIVADHLQRKSFIAIGETGLDFYWDKTFILQQYRALEFQIELALQYDLPLVLHTRNATQETIDIIKNYTSRGLTGIFHCFGGSADEARQIIDNNFSLGIGGVVTYKNGGLDKVLKNVPMEQIVLETDAPYLSPVPYRGKRNESKYLKEIIKKIAEIKQISDHDVAAISTKNAEKIFKFS